MFKGVKLSADGPGSFVLRAASATRKVAVEDATVTVQVCSLGGCKGCEQPLLAQQVAYDAFPVTLAERFPRGGTPDPASLHAECKQALG